MQTERRVAANPQTKPVDLGCESAENWQLSSTPTATLRIEPADIHTGVNPAGDAGDTSPQYFG